MLSCFGGVQKSRQHVSPAEERGSVHVSGQDNSLLKFGRSSMQPSALGHTEVSED
jgi:hypothetical protein